MKQNHIILLTLIIVAVAFTGSAMAQFTLDQDVLGAHNINGRGCVSCHTPHSGSAGAGGTDTSTGTIVLWGTSFLGKTYTTYGGITLTTFPTVASFVNGTKDPLYRTAICLTCHAPHSAMAGPATPLWNQQLSMQTYTAYTSSTYHQTGVQPPLGSTSKLCLSCHDGTVAPGQTVAYGKFNMTGSMKTTSKFGGDLRSSHPISMKTPLTDSPEINVLLSSATPNTADPAVKLERGNVECNTCHDPHVQGKDRVVQDFLVRDGSNGALCLACHDPNRVVNGNVNFLGGWAVSAHATATNTTSNQPYVGGYGTVAGNACTNCHMEHNASGPVRLLRGSDEKACLACHNGGTNISPAAINVFAEFAKTGHPFSSGTNVHDRTESAVLNNNRHATCVDCHNPHAGKSAGTAYAAPPAVRSAQAEVVGISVSDGLTVMSDRCICIP